MRVTYTKLSLLLFPLYLEPTFYLRGISKVFLQIFPCIRTETDSAEQKVRYKSKNWRFFDTSFKNMFSWNLVAVNVVYSFKKHNLYKI